MIRAGDPENLFYLAVPLHSALPLPVSILQEFVRADGIAETSAISFPREVVLPAFMKIAVTIALAMKEQG